MTTLILPLTYFFISPSARKLYFETTTTVQTNAPIKVILTLSLLIISMFFLKNIDLILEFNSRIRTSNQPKLVIFIFFIFVFLPIFLAELKIRFFAKLFYQLLRVSYLDPPFADLRTTIIAIGCKNVNNIGDIISCDTRSSEFVTWIYPTVILKLRPLENFLNNIQFLVVAFSILMTLLLYSLSRKLNKPQNALLILLLVSPPFLLCFSRMNLDIFILLFIWGGLYLFQAKSTLLQDLSWICFTFAGLLKFYGFFSFISIFYSNKIRKTLIGLLTLSFAISIVWSDLTNLSDSIGRDIYGSIGLSVITSLLNGEDYSTLKITSVGFLLTVGSLVILTCLTLMNHDLGTSVKKPDVLGNVFGFTFLITWISASNYYYRLILLFPVLIELIRENKSYSNRLLVSFTFLSFFLSPKVFGVLQNVFLLPILSLILARLIYIICSNGKKYADISRNGSICF